MDNLQNEINEEEDESNLYYSSNLEINQKLSNNSNCESDNFNEKLHEICKLSKWQENKKTYEFDYEYNNLKSNTKMVFVEKSPKGRFRRFEEEIGKGSFKHVYRAYDFDEGKEVAWNKICTLDLGSKELNKIYDEINLLKNLNHPQIMKYIFGWYDCVGNQLNLISELFTGGNLNQ